MRVAVVFVAVAVVFAMGNTVDTEKDSRAEPSLPETIARSMAEAKAFFRKRMSPTGNSDRRRRFFEWGDDEEEEEEDFDWEEDRGRGRGGYGGYGGGYYHRYEERR